MLHSSGAQGSSGHWVLQSWSWELWALGAARLLKDPLHSLVSGGVDFYLPT